MAELSESELLLLDNLMYSPLSSRQGLTLRDALEAYRVNGEFDLKKMGATPNCSNEDYIKMLNDAYNNPNISNLTIEKSRDTTTFRASCFVSPDGDVTVAFRGTGTTGLEWKDNVQGAYMTDTHIQNRAATFIQDDCAEYSNITVTGHSKGGNMAQYVTVVAGDQIDRCVSYDGQGFGKSFHEEHAAEIKKNQGKIKSINAHNDYVHILLTPIAASTVYLKNDGKGILDGHFPENLYLHNTCDPNSGIYEETVQQNPLIKALQDGLRFFTEEIDERFSKEQQGVLYDFIGTALGLGLGQDKITYTIEEVDTILRDLRDTVLLAWENRKGKSQLRCRARVNPYSLQNASVALKTCGDRLADQEETLFGLRANLSDDIIAKLAGGILMTTLIHGLRENISDLKKMEQVLSSCAEQYEATEDRAVTALR